MRDLLVPLVGVEFKRHRPVIDCKEGGVLAAVDWSGVAGTGLEFEVEHGLVVCDACWRVVYAWEYFFFIIRNTKKNAKGHLRRASTCFSVIGIVVV